MDRSEFVPTSIAKRMMTRLHATHFRRGISVFSGPPGLGKTTAIEAFKADFPDNVIVMKIANQAARDLAVMQHAIEAIRELGYGGGSYAGNLNAYDARAELRRELEAWSWRHEIHRVGTGTEASAPTLTFVYDEAQNLSRNAIESLRYWNDLDRCYGPFPIGLVFCGNNEFALAADKSGHSQISAAVADRAMYTERYEYSHTTNADLKLFIASFGITDDAAVHAFLKHYSTPRMSRSLRQVQNHARDIVDEADGQPIAAAHVWAVIAP